MSAGLSAIALLFTVLVSGEDDGWKTKTNEQGKVVQELKIEAPTFTEEDQYGYNMPDRYRCDSCKAVMYHLDEELRKQHPKSRRMKQWEYTDAMEEACRNAFQGYGVKLVNGENTLSGPGLRDNEEAIAPGGGAIQMGGESWTKRLAEVCRKMVFEKVGEDELYDKLYSKIRADADGETGTLKKLTEDICTKETRDCIVGPKGASPRPRPRDNAKDETKATKAKAKEGKTKEAKAKEKKAKEPKAKKEGKATTAASKSAAGEAVDVQAFLRSLAVKHGLTSDEYITKRTDREWEKLILAISGRIYNRMAEQEL